MIISIANQKGGVGKTTTTQAFFYGLTQQGYKTLAIDLDPQSNMSTAIGAETSGLSIYEVMNDKCEINEAIQQINDFGFALPSNILLAGAEIEFYQKMKREELLVSKLKNIKTDYDFVLIDTPPALGLLTINAFSSSDKIVIPMGADVFSLQGVGQLNDTIIQVRKYCNPHLTVEGILLTKYNPRTILSKDLTNTINDIANRLNTKVYENKIRNSVSIQEAQTQSADILAYSNSSAQQDYKAFITEFLEGLNK